jgi:hypothetical protein
VPLTAFATCPKSLRSRAVALPVDMKT